MSTIQIGSAAALFGVAPSTLRWWEQHGVLGNIAQHTGRRRYAEPDLRRLGVAYLCHVTGKMPLELTRRVTAGPDTCDWRAPVHEHVNTLRAQIDQLTAAHDYLLDLVTCASDDPCECPYLDASLQQHTPRCKSGEETLLDAARAASRA